ncbi:MAG: hypothetical protein K0U37_05535 [Gammaproteobacteria bacterium]|nr:hypothetical protein [Gammaproteobacteria bacterium]
MAKPDFNKRVISESMQFLKLQNYDVLISLEVTPQYKLEAEKAGLEYIELHVADFQSPSIQICDTVFDIIDNAAEAGKQVGLHCGEGFGRTGMVLAAVKLKELICNMSFDELLEEELSEDIKLGDKRSSNHAMCTPLVKQVIDEIRAVSRSEEAVETREQVQVLCDYQAYVTHQQKSLLQETQAGELAESLQTEFTIQKTKHLEVRVLLDFKSGLEDILDTEALATFVEDFMQTDDYRKLASISEITDTSVISEIDALILEKSKALIANPIIKPD